MRDERQETRDKRQETRDGRWEMGDGRLDAGDVVRGNKGDLLKCQECQTYFRRVTRQQVILIKFPTMRHASAFALRQ